MGIKMNYLIEYQWGIFITIEILSLIALLLFGAIRYFFDKRKLSIGFIFLFIALLFIEGILAFIIYRMTGEFSTFQMVIIIFLIYACTFGINDFKKLDRWMRGKVGKWRGKELLTEKDYEIIAKNKDPKYVAKKYRLSSFIHFIVFIIAQSIFWLLGTDNIGEMLAYIKDFSWVESGSAENSPYPNDTLYAIGILWGIIFIVDVIYSWSYTLFPSKRKDN